MVDVHSCRLRTFSSNRRSDSPSRAQPAQVSAVSASIYPQLVFALLEKFEDFGSSLHVHGGCALDVWREPKQRRPHQFVKARAHISLFKTSPCTRAPAGTKPFSQSGPILISVELGLSNGSLLLLSIQSCFRVATEWNPSLAFNGRDVWDKGT